MLERTAELDTCCAAPRVAARHASRLTAPSRTWRALPVVVIAALVPKCPLCLLGLLTVLGATNLQRPLLAWISAPALLWMSIALVAAASVWLALRRGLAGGLVGALAAALVVCGKQVYPSTALVAAGVALLAGYVFLGPRLSRALTQRPA